MFHRKTQKTMLIHEFVFQKASNILKKINFTKKQHNFKTKLPFYIKSHKSKEGLH